jgi:hypothetical protein
MKKITLAILAGAFLFLTSCEVEVRDGVTYHHHMGYEHQHYPDHHEQYNHGYHHDAHGGELKRD